MLPPWLWLWGEPMPSVAPCTRCDGKGQDIEFVHTPCLLCGGSGRADTRKPIRGYIGWVRLKNRGPRLQWWPATCVVASQKKAWEALALVCVSGEEGGRCILPSGVHPDPLNP